MNQTRSWLTGILIAIPLAFLDAFRFLGNKALDALDKE